MALPGVTRIIKDSIHCLPAKRTPEEQERWDEIVRTAQKKNIAEYKRKVDIIKDLLERYSVPRSYAGDFYGDYARRILEAIGQGEPHKDNRI